MTVEFMDVAVVTEPTSGYDLKGSDWASQSPFPWVSDTGLHRRHKGPHNNQQCLGPAQHQAGGRRVTQPLAPLVTGLQRLKRGYFFVYTAQILCAL